MDDPEDLWDVNRAADWATAVRRRILGPAAHVSPDTIWQWVRRGHLDVAERRGRQLRLTHLAVARAEARTRERARRTVAA